MKNKNFGKNNQKLLLYNYYTIDIIILNKFKAPIKRMPVFICKYFLSLIPHSQDVLLCLLRKILMYVCAPLWRLWQFCLKFSALCVQSESVICVQWESEYTHQASVFFELGMSLGRIYLFFFFLEVLEHPIDVWRCY